MPNHPKQADTHSKDTQYILFDALATNAEALERLTEAALSLAPYASVPVRSRLRDAVARSAESFRLTVSAWHAWVQLERHHANADSTPMRPEYDFTEGIRGPVCSHTRGGSETSTPTAKDPDNSSEGTS